MIGLPAIRRPSFRFEWPSAERAWPRFSGRAGAMLASAEHRLPLLYMVWAMIVGSAIAVVMPAWQNPDEAAHLHRAVQISRGGLLGYRWGHTAGGLSDAAINQSGALLSSLPFHPETKINQTMEAASAAVRWGAPSLVPFPNTAMYPPFLYAAAVPAVWIGQAGRMHVVATLRLVRVFDAVAAACVGALALALARRTRLAIGAVLALPMAVALAASASQDALLIPLAALAVAIIDRVRSRPGRAAGVGELCAVAACLLTVMLARPPYVPLAALMLLLRARPRFLPAAIACALAAATIAWSGYVARNISISFVQADPAAQALILMHDPMALGHVVSNTLYVYWRAYVDSTVGLLGWVDTWLPVRFLDSARWVILLAMLSAAIPEPFRDGRLRWVSFAAAWLAAAAVLVSMYLIWTPVAATTIDGVQGRYFLPLLPALALGMPSLGRWAGLVRPPALLAVVALAAVTPIVVLTAIVTRYYLGA